MPKKLKICIRCKKEGYWYEDMCGRCKSMLREREIIKSPAYMMNVVRHKKHERQ